MADPTRAIPQLVTGYESKNYTIADTIVMVTGMLAAIRKGNHATTQGEAQQFANARDLLFAGLNGSDETGDPSAAQPPKARLMLQPFVLKNKSVTGVSSAADIFKPVFSSDSDTDNSLTLTKPDNNSDPIGVIIAYNSDGSVDILVIGIDHKLADVGKREAVLLGNFSAAIPATATLRDGLVLPYYGKIVEVFAMFDETIAGAGGDVDINLAIDADGGGSPVSLTGGVVKIEENDARPAKEPGTAVTGNNEFGPNDQIDVAATVNTATTGGRFELWAIVERMA